jgi:hypothetical protein
VLGNQLGHVTDRMSEMFHGEDRECPSRIGDIDVSRSAAELIDCQAGGVTDEPAGIDQIDPGERFLGNRTALVIEPPDRVMVVDEAFVVGDIFPPREVPDVVVEPTHLGHVSHLFEVGGSSVARVFFEPAESGSNVDEARTAPPGQSGMTAPFVTRGIVGQTRGNRVQVHIGQQLTKIDVISDETGFVTTLPQSPEQAVPVVETAGDPTLDPRHAAPERRSPGLDHQVVVVAHQAPPMHEEPVQSLHIGDGVHEFVRLERIREHHLAARRAAVHVVDGAWEENPG